MWNYYFSCHFLFNSALYWLVSCPQSNKDVLHDFFVVVVFYVPTSILHFRGNMVDAFRVHIMQTKELGTCPVRQIGGCSFFYMRISNVYIVIVVSSNANVACAFKFVVEVVSFFFLFTFFSGCAFFLFNIFLRSRFSSVFILS